MRGYPNYETVSEKKAKAQSQLDKLKKKNPDINPIIIDGNKIAKTWWAISWNKNLESYADYSNRINRGKSYVKNGFVLDLIINAGSVEALVQGTRKKPYSVHIEITPLTKDKWNNIVQKCSHKISNIAELAEGRFPKELSELFTEKESGLFPNPTEIRFLCSCPDWAYMCKHTAAVLYAIGSRFDSDPTLFFKLRDIDFTELLKKSVESKMDNMLKRANTKSKRIIADSDIKDLFGV